jgi:methylated-DNA-protein-cysteine methyltransferase-like protein
MSRDALYRLVKTIPRGRVATYGQVARAVKLRGGARAAGRAMAQCPSGRGIPWHRVLGAGGRILIREPVAQLQRQLLQSEGVRFIERRVDLRTHAWLPRKQRRMVTGQGRPKSKNKKRR